MVVHDTGLGIPEDAQEDIFNKPFFKAHDNTYQGNGLSLYLCKQICERAGGSIAVQSTLGSGSYFIFSFQVLIQPTNDASEFGDSAYVLDRQ